MADSQKTPLKTRRLFRYFLIISGAGLVIFLGLSFYAYYLLKNLEGPLLLLAKQHIQGRVELHSAQVKLFPTAFEVKGVKLYAPQANEAAIVVPAASLQLKMTSLLWGEKILASLELRDPQVHWHSPETGPSNLEVIFQSPKKKSDAENNQSHLLLPRPLASYLYSPVLSKAYGADLAELTWLQRLVIEELIIKNGQLKTTKPGESPVEFQDIQLEAQGLRLDSPQAPAQVSLQTVLPHLNTIPFHLNTKLFFISEKTNLVLREGRLQWGALKSDLTGEVGLPSPNRKEIQLNINFDAQSVEVQQLAKLFSELPAAYGKTKISGSVTGSPPHPLLSLKLNSSDLNFQGYPIKNLLAQIQKQGVPIQIQQASFNAWGGKFKTQGRLLPNQKKSTKLDLSFNGDGIDTQALSQVFPNLPPMVGRLNLSGQAQGTTAQPKLILNLNAAQLQIQKHNLKNIQAQLQKQGEAIDIQKASFDIYRGQLVTSGRLTPQAKRTTADLNVQAYSLSVEDLSGKTNNPARLSGILKFKTKNLAQYSQYFGNGQLQVGPIILPQKNLSNKVQIAEILSAGVGLNKRLNLGLLRSSAQVIGTQLKEVKANVELAGDKILLKPFSMGNQHFSAQGNGTIIQQKNITGNGTFTLSRMVTQQLIPDLNLRKYLTKGRHTLSFPFTMKGPIEDPTINVDSRIFKEKLARALAEIIVKEGVKIDPKKAVEEVLRKTPLPKVKNPLEKILQPQPRPQPKQPTQPKKPSTGNKALDQLLFGK